MWTRFADGRPAPRVRQVGSLITIATVSAVLSAGCAPLNPQRVTNISAGSDDRDGNGRPDSQTPLTPHNSHDMQSLIDHLGAYVDDGDTGHVALIDGNQSGYASLVIRSRSVLEIYWKGDVPDAVTTTIDAHPAVTTTIHPVRWSLAELVEARDAAVRLLRDQFPGIALTAVGPLPDASGLLVQLGDATATDAVTVDAAVTGATGIATTVETDVQIIPAADRRRRD